MLSAVNEQHKRNCTHLCTHDFWRRETMRNWRSLNNLLNSNSVQCVCVRFFMALLLFYSRQCALLFYLTILFSIKFCFNFFFLLLLLCVWMFIVHFICFVLFFFFFLTFHCHERSFLNHSFVFKFYFDTNKMDFLINISLLFSIWVHLNR